MIKKLVMEDFRELSGKVTLADILPNYSAPANRFDELTNLDHDSFVAWLHLLTESEALDCVRCDVDQIFSLGACITERWRRVKHWLQEHNTSLSNRSTLPAHRTWELDPIPLVIVEHQWKALAAGISQRAKLLDEITRDLYGPQRLLADGSVPLELVYGSSSYIPSMQATIRAGEPAIYLYGVQLCRNREGQWQALADRTQGPSGCGYTVENRIALSRVLSEEFRDFHVQRSAGFFATLRDTIAAYANMRQPEANTILLSPGVRSETFFEDAYLARYLGYTLAQTEDLTVRGGEVFQKTLSGLVRVQSILRRVQDDKCDPLEFASNAGVPGLCQAVRDGTVAIANPIGCGWAEMPAVAALLPDLCSRVLGEELILPSIPMHWCGKPEELQYVRDNIDGLEIRDALQRSEFSETSMIASRSREERDELLRKIERDPWKFVAIEPIEFSTAPVWHNDRIEPWPMVMRAFATLAEEEYAVLDGGIARLGPIGTVLGESLGTGELSKDVWVLGSEPPVPLTLRRPPQKAIELRRSNFELPSRVAENLFWLGRSTQRAECMIRHARTVANRLIEETDLHLAQSYAAIFDAMDMSPDRTWPAPLETSGDILQFVRERLHETLLDSDNPNSLCSVLWSIESNMVMVRDRLSVDGYQLLSNLVAFRGRNKLANPGDLGDTLFELSGMLTSLSAFSGMVAENMTRGPGWLFLDIGVRIERIKHQLHVLQSCLMHDYAWMTPMLEAVLEIMDSSMTYRFRYLMSVEIDPTIDLLLVDETNPRAIAFQLLRLDELTAALQVIDAVGLAEQRGLIADNRAAIRLIDAESLSILNTSSKELMLPMIPPEIIRLPKAKADVETDKDARTIREVFPGLLSSDKKRYALKMLTDRIEFTINELHGYLSNRFFVHTASVQRIGDSR